MSNTFIVWAGFALPWLTLMFMKKDDVKRLMPVAVMAALTSIIIYDIGLRIGLWSIRETYFPFASIPPYFFGLFSVLTIWIFKFTYGRFWVYMLTNLIFDIGFNFFYLGYFLPIRGIWDFNTIPIMTLPITLVHAVILYGYQIWQESVLLPSSQTNSFSLHPAAAKPIQQNEDNPKVER